MVNALFLVIGLTLLMLSLLDMLWTTFKSAGPITKVIIAIFKKTGSYLLCHIPHGTNVILTLLTIYVNFVIICTWLALTIIGYLFIFTSTSGAFINGTTGAYASTYQIFYTSMVTVATLGYGDYVPVEGYVMFFAPLAAFSGFAVLTIGLTYLVSVSSSLTLGQAVAWRIFLRGRTAEELVVNFYKEKQFETFNSWLCDISHDVIAYYVNLNSHPVLSVMHSSRQMSVVGAVALLDESLTLIESCCNQDENLARNVSKPQLYVCRQAISCIMDSVKPPFAHMPGDVSSPNIDMLRDAGVPMPSDDQMSRTLNDMSQHRALLDVVCRTDGYSLNDLHLNSRLCMNSDCV